MKRIASALTIALMALSANAQGIEGYSPNDVNDAQATWKVTDAGLNVVEFSFTAPTTMTDQEWNTADIPADVAISKITISRMTDSEMMYEEVAAIENPEKGQAYTLVDDNNGAGLSLGAYQYTINVHIGEASSWGYMLDVTVGELPNYFMDEDFIVTQDPEDEYKVTLEVTLPTLNDIGEPLNSPYTKLVFGEMTPMSMEPMPIYTEEAAEVLVPGATVQYVIDHVNDGLHLYTVQAFTAAGSNWPLSKELFVGKDQPGTVQNITVEVTAEGNVISWEAPVIGLNGGDQGDISAITYTVTRGTDFYDPAAVVIAEGISELTVTDVTDFTEETRFLYIITASSPYGNGYPTASEELIQGPAALLPFAENFDVVADEYGNTTYEHSTWQKTTSFYYCAWQLGQETYIGETVIKPYNGGGLLYAYYDNWGLKDQWDAITSGHIDCSSIELPAMSFMLYDLNCGGTDVTLKVEVSTDDENFTTVKEIVMGNAETEGWTKVIFELNELAGATSAVVRFMSVAKGENCIPVVIDAIKIADLDGVGISSVAADKAQSEVRFNLQGQRTNAQKGLMIEDGKLMFIK